MKVPTNDDLELAIISASENVIVMQTHAIRMRLKMKEAWTAMPRLSEQVVGIPI